MALERSGERSGDLVFGSIGDRVRLAQRALCAGGCQTGLDGVFGRGTENAVRDYQRAHGLLPDGRIGPRTAALLHLVEAAAPSGKLTDLAARFGPAVAGQAEAALAAPPPQGAKRDCAVLRVSEQGLRFILAEETGAGSGDVCWPRGHSGVTLGAGYDMRARPAARIEADMLAVGLSQADAAVMETASGRCEQRGGAEAWVRAHPRWPGLSGLQQMALLRRIIPEYEAVVHRVVHAALWQYSFDALVSVAYNPGRPMAPLAENIDAGAYAAAAQDILSRVGDDPQVARGLKARREREVALFLYGDYGQTDTA